MACFGANRHGRVLCLFASLLTAGCIRPRAEVRDALGLKPGTSALFVLDVPNKLEVILDKFRGLGGTVLKTNVDVDRAKLVQSTLGADASGTSKPDSP